jgi:hypothetical protein
MRPVKFRPQKSFAGVSFVVEWGDGVALIDKNYRSSEDDIFT